MAKFAKAEKQAASVIKDVQGSVLSSVGTARNYEQALKKVAQFARSEKIEGGLRGLTPEKAVIYLEQRGQEVGQSTLNMERQAIQYMMQHVTHQLQVKEKLQVIKSEHEQLLQARAYTKDQVDLIAAHQTSKHALATRIAYASGLRAHELLTLRPIEERAPDLRPNLISKWQGRTGDFYTVEGKGGLIRTVLIPSNLSNQLKLLRLPTPKIINDRGVYYQSAYNIGGGQLWSNSFSSAANRCLGWSEGAHGVRHSYAQERMSELQQQGLSRSQSLETVSQEMGHFRPDITEVYLR